MRVPGSFASNRSEIPSSGWTLTISRLGATELTRARLKISSGGRLNWIAISVVRLGSRLPVRR